MARKGENIYLRKDGRWEGRYKKEPDESGITKYGYVYGRKYREVKQKLRELIQAEMKSKKARAQYKGTLNEWSYEWLGEIKKPYIKLSTYANYRNKLETHILPQLGETGLNDISKSHIQKLFDQLGNGILSENSIRTLFRIVKAIFQEAEQQKFIKVNPCSGVILPKVRKQKRKALTRTEQQILEQQALKTVGNEAVIIALYTGMQIAGSAT